MPVGLQTWDASGRLMLDATNRIGRILTSFNTGGSNGSVNVPGLVGAGTPFYYVTVDLDNLVQCAFPAVSISGSTVSWTFIDYERTLYPYGAAPRIPVTVNVGVY